MADNPKKFKLPQSNRARILMLVVAAAGVLLVGTLLFRLHRARKAQTTTAGASQLSGVPGGIQSLPGGKQASQQYLKVLLRENQLKANNALKTGQSAIPTIVNTGQTYVQTSDFQAATQAHTSCPPCGVQGSGSVLDQLAASGAITPDVAADLQRLQNQGVSVDAYAAELKRLVAEGKLTPEQAAKLLADYRARHGLASATHSPADIASQLLASGAITPETARELAQLAAKNLTAAQYRAALQKLVAEGKLTPEQARQLMNAYLAKHGQAGAVAGMSQSPADVADNLLASGAITPETAQALAGLNNQGLSPDDYAARLQELVKEGKLTPAAARQLLAAYRHQHATAGTPLASSTSPGDVAGQLLASGAIPPATAHELSQLNQTASTPSQYRAALQRMVTEGKLTAAQAQALMDAYNRKHGEATAAVTGGGDTPAGIANQLLASGAITPATERELAALANENLSPDAYAARIERLVAEGKLTPEQAQALIAAYRRTHTSTATTLPTTAAAAAAGAGDLFAQHDALLDQLKESGEITPQVAAQLGQLSAQNVPASQYATQLATLARSGALSPSEAQRLLDAYIAKHGQVKLTSRQQENPQLAQLEQLRQQQQLRVQREVLAQLQQQQAQEQSQQAAQQLNRLESAMRSQSSAMLTAWSAPTPARAVIDTEEDKTKEGGAAGMAAAAVAGATGAASAAAGGAITPPLLKAGTIMFAVLNTALDSDRPGVVMATIVSGRFKGARLMGGLTRKKDRLELSFTRMTMPEWPDVVTIKSVAINPDTARTAIASQVNYHYLSRYGSLMASSFLAGYGQAVQNSGNTTISGDGTVVSTSDTYSPAGRFMIALGAVGQELSAAARKNFDRPPTVKIDVGVGLGILFEQDVPTPKFLLNNGQGSGLAASQPGDTASAMGN